ncbi:hypothetical protein ACLOJK_038325 [Asimina triloba]
MVRPRYSASCTVSLLYLAAGLSSPIECVCLGTSLVPAPPSLTFSESPIFSIPPGRFCRYLDDPFAGSLSSSIFCVCLGRWPVPLPPFS